MNGVQLRNIKISKIEGLIMLNFIIGLIIGAVIGFGLCAVLSANGRDNDD